MKNRIKFSLFILVPFLCSCQKFLDTPPKSQLSVTNFWKSADDAELGLAGVYSAFQNAFRQDFWRWGELRADNFEPNERPEINIAQVLENALTPTTTSADWTSLYKAIATANNAYKKISDIPSFAEKNDLLAQILSLRALLYFYAVRVWGNTPKVTEPVTGIQQDMKLPRTSVDEIFKDIIIPDLQNAEQLISTKRSINYISLGAILAIKADVYMWPGSFQSFTIARDAITKLEGLGYSLETTKEGWLNIFRGPAPQNSNEIVFSLSWNFVEDGNNGLSQFVNNAPKLVPSEALGNKWESILPGDYRMLGSAAFDIEVVNPLAFPPLRVLTKYSGNLENRDVQQSWGIMNDRAILFYRLSDLLLLKAEAENYLNNPEGAITLINKIRTARELPLVNASITDQIIIRDIILTERQFELMGEGKRYWDLVRNNVVLQVMTPINGMNDPRKILWPVSQNVMNRNPNINQNDGY